MCVRVPGRIDRRRISHLASRSRDHAEGFCGGSVMLVVGGKGGSIREAALFLFVSSESICDSALECVRLG